MKKVISIMLMVFVSSILATPHGAFSTSGQANAFELNTITDKDINKVMEEMPLVIPEPVKTLAQSPYYAAEQLKEELRLRGVFTNVTVVQVSPVSPKRVLLLVEFPNWEVFKEVQDVFTTDDHGNLFYMGYHVRPLVPREKIPFIAKDAFDGLQACTIVNAVFVRQPTLKEAVNMLEPCMKAVSKKYGITVSASQSLMPHTNASQQAAPHGVGGQGIGILVSGQLLIGNPVLRDLNHSVNKIHGGYLLTWPAYVQYLGEIIPY
jgi:hypothetical protein